MKISELNTLIENIVSQEVKKTLIKESEGGKEVYHITCEGVPLATFESEKEAQDALPDYKAKHKGDLIIEKGQYESHDDMMNKLDEMNDQLEETDTMEDNQSNEGNAFSGALAKAKEQGDNEFEVDGNEYDVNEDECVECGGMGMEEHDSNLGECKKCGCGGDINEEGCCNECGQMQEHAQDGDPENLCPKCGKELCECGLGIYESKKKKTIRLTESEFKKLISNMVNESVPGLRAAEKAHRESGKENKAALSDIEKEISKALSFFASQ